MTDGRGLNHAIAHEEVHDGIEVGVYRASAVGYCEWALLASRMGIDGAAPPEAMQRVFDEGHDNEERILRMFFEANKYLARLDDDDVQSRVQGVMVGGIARIVGHVDALAQHGPEVIAVVEAKALGDSLWKEFIKGDGFPTGGLWDKYRDQVEVYMAAAGAYECGFVVGHKINGVVEEISEKWLKPDMERLAKIKAKIATVEGRARGGVALPERCDVGDWPCAYYGLIDHPKKTVEAVVIENDKLARAMAEFHTAGQDEKAAGERKKAARGILDGLLGIHVKDSPGEMDRVVHEIRVGEQVECGEWLVKLVERKQPESVRKAYTQRYYDVKPKKG